MINWYKTSQALPPPHTAVAVKFEGGDCIYDICELDDEAPESAPSKWWFPNRNQHTYWADVDPIAWAYLD